MRTTVTINDDLYRQAKEIAARSGRNLGDVLDDALRVLLVDRPRASAEKVSLPRFGGSGLQPGVDLEAKDALVALLDGGDAYEPGPGVLVQCSLPRSGVQD